METLGEGGFGVVYRAEPLLPGGGLQNQVVLKVLRGQDFSDEAVQRLRSEARVLKRLNHPAVIGIEDMVPLDHGWAVVMEYVSGIYLSELIDEGPLPATVALELIEDVAGALQAAYTAPIDEGRRLCLMHRDLRPANIRITPEGKVKVLDFGGARVEFAQTSESIEKSRPYLSPERLEGVEGHEGDIYALGIIFAECLLGEYLGTRNGGTEEHSHYLEHLSNRLRRRIFRDNPDLPEALGEAVVDIAVAMLALNPDERPDAREVADACRLLRKELDGEWIRLWAQKTVARKLADQATLMDDEVSGSVFSERADGHITEEPELTLANRKVPVDEEETARNVRRAAGLPEHIPAVEEAEERGSGMLMSFMAVLVIGLLVALYVLVG